MKTVTRAGKTRIPTEISSTAGCHVDIRSIYALNAQTSIQLVYTTVAQKWRSRPIYINEKRNIIMLSPIDHFLFLPIDSVFFISRIYKTFRTFCSLLTDRKIRANWKAYFVIFFTALKVLNQKLTCCFWWHGEAGQLLET